jgi:hypothetical protein
MIQNNLGEKPRVPEMDLSILKRPDDGSFNQISSRKRKMSTNSRASNLENILKDAVEDPDFLDALIGGDDLDT